MHNHRVNAQRWLFTKYFQQPCGVLTALILFLLGFSMIFQARLLAFLTDRLFTAGQSTDALSFWFGLAAAVITIRAVLSWLASALAARTSQRIKQNLRRDIMDAALKSSYNQREPDPVSWSAYLAGEGVEQLDAFFSQYVPTFVLAVLFPLQCVAFILPFDWLSAVIFLVTAPLIPVFMILIAQGAETATRRQWRGLQRMSAYLSDSIRGLLELRRLGQIRQRLESLDQVEANYRRDTLAVLRMTFLSAFALEFIATISTAIIAVEIGIRLLQGAISFEVGFFILLLAPDFYTVLRAVGLRYHASAPGLETAAQILDSENHPAAQTAEPRPVMYSGGKAPEIEFLQVSARYPNRDESALNDLDFVLPAGAVTALVGPNGAGKTTTAALLMGFMAPEQGKILVNGINLAEMDLSSWQARIGWLPHLPAVFTGSFLENLTGRQWVENLDPVWDALELAGLANLVRTWPRGLFEPLGEDGKTLSAGERQRLGLARLLLRCQDLLILDEPSAYLDAPGEIEFSHLLHRLAQGRTVLLIAHRRASVALASQVITLRSGRIADIRSSATTILNQTRGERLL